MLGLPRGGVPVAREVADHLGAPLDVVVVRKLGAPTQPELALGAIAGSHAVVLNDEVMRALGVQPRELDTIIDAQRAIATARESAYRRDRSPLSIDGKTVIVVDDGLATGATMRAALEALRTRRTRTLIAAAPVAPSDIHAVLDGVADRVEIVATPPDFVAVGLWYDDFRQTTDDEVRQLLSR